ncbi:CD209 antigen-like protein C [Aquarana catesbeiana]|uniref:CD209 antigen-like protein C n=1 Tax=Aquarana catesbeiana TaxID=8400 RepID=UPI003CC9F62D
MRNTEDLQMEMRVHGQEGVYDNVRDLNVQQKNELKAKGRVVQILMVLQLLLSLILLILLCVLFIFCSSMMIKVTEMESTINNDLRNGIADLLCGKDWKFYNVSCYFKSSSEQTWDSAKQACQDMNARLVIINGDGEMEFLRKFSGSKDRPWVGLKMEKSNIWKWVDGTSYNSRKFWQKTQPDYYEGKTNEGCAEMRNEDSPEDDYGLNDVPCILMSKYICEKASP